MWHNPKYDTGSTYIPGQSVEGVVVHSPDLVVVEAEPGHVGQAGEGLARHLLYLVTVEVQRVDAPQRPERLVRNLQRRWCN